jgi:hypothetical protein
MFSMSATAAQDLADRVPRTFEEFRDAWATEESSGLLARVMHRWILRLLTALVTLLAEARARRLEAEAQGAEALDAGAEAGVAEVGAADTDGRVDARAESMAGKDDEIAREKGTLVHAGASRAREAKPMPVTSDRYALAGAEDARAAVDDAKPTLRAATTPHPPASGPIFASKNGSPSWAPRRSASRPNPSRGEGFSSYGRLKVPIQKDGLGLRVLLCPIGYVIETINAPAEPPKAASGRRGRA